MAYPYQNYPNYQNFNQNYNPNYNQQNNSSLIWVQGIEGAKSYMVAPNCTVQLWDSEAQVIYLKSADASGMPSIKILDYTIRDVNTSSNPTSVKSDDTDIFATKEDILSLQEEIAELKAQIKPKKVKKGEADNE